MAIESIGLLELSPSISESSAPQQSAGPGNFAQWMDREMAAVNSQIQRSEHMVVQLATGEQTNLHEVMMSLEKAKLQFELMLQVRNKVLEGYQEIMRMQV